MFIEWDDEDDYDSGPNKTQLSPEEVRQLWIDALRSGKYQQCTYNLKTARGMSHSYCCLGVLADLYIQHNSDQANWNEYDKLRYGHEEYSELLPQAILNWAGINYSQQLILSGYNDAYETFNHIAYYIENHLK